MRPPRRSTGARPHSSPLLRPALTVTAIALAVLILGGAWATRDSLALSLGGTPSNPGSNVPALDDAQTPPAGDAPTVTAAERPSPVTVLATGDIASCDQTGDEDTAVVVAAHPEATILGLGDFAYPDGTAADFANCFDASWGQFKDRIRPVPGNHEYHTANADPYFAYFGARAGAATRTDSRGYYSFDLGAWHLIALNSEQDFGADGAQLAWLRADLAANNKQCVLAYWHRPRYTTSEWYSDIPDTQPFWAALTAAHAEIVLNGHDHDYQRYAPLDAAGHADPAYGIREFVVGTGGRASYALIPDNRREAQAVGVFGILQLTLADGGYQWSLLPTGGGAPLDSGSGTCH